MNFLSFLFPLTIATINSFFNGKIYVKEFFGRKYIEVDGLMQSGLLLEKLFKRGFSKFKLFDKDLKHILLLGVGGGTVLKFLRKYFPNANIHAIDIDEKMIQIGKKYFDLSKLKNIEFTIGDVFDPKTNLGVSYDLIIVDLFKGYSIPKQLADRKYLTKLRTLLNKNGCVIFNRLYFQKYISEADFFVDKIKEIFKDVVVVKIYFNILIKAY